jgi:hypothetical protein
MLDSISLEALADVGGAAATRVPQPRDVPAGYYNGTPRRVDGMFGYSRPAPFGGPSSLGSFGILIH